MKSVDLLGVQLESEGHTVLLLLQERDEPRRVLPLLVGAPEASAIALGAMGTPPPRPLTHDLLVTSLTQLGARIDHVEVTGYDDETFFADLVLHGPAGDLRIDARPSDAIALAVRTQAPLFVDDHVLDTAGTELEELELDAEEDGARLDPEEIEFEVAAFRELLADVDADDFGGDPSGESGGPPSSEDV